MMGKCQLSLFVFGYVHVSIANAKGVLESFDKFVEQYGRTYQRGSAEYAQRKALYEERISKARSHNSDLIQRWTQGTNQHSDWTHEELAMLLGRRGTASHQDMHIGNSHSSFLSLRQESRGHVLPMEVSWANLSAASRIPNQGGCGSCWAVAAAKVLEMHTEIHQPPWKHRTFSAQQLIDCVPNPNECGGKGGCRGATVELAFEYVMKNGLARESELPYKGSDESCPTQSLSHEVGTPKSFLQQFRDMDSSSLSQHDNYAMDFGMASWHRLAENKLEPLMRAVAEKGPVGVSVSADTWFSYDSGILDACAPDAIVNHAVVLLGYGTAEKSPDKYWLIQNSWGSEWGENGKIRILRHNDEEEFCGTDNDPNAGNACKGGPPKVTICGSCGILYDTAVPLFVTQDTNLANTRVTL